MRSHSVVLFFVVLLVGFGFWSLSHLKKNEFPSVAIRQGVVAVVYPGATADEIEQQVTGPVENFLFGFSEVDKRETYSYSKDGVLYVFVTLKLDTKDPGLVWSRIRESLVLFRVTSLPQGVLATAVIDNINDASSLLIAVESEERSPRELRETAERLSKKLRSLPELGNVQIVGEQKEEIAVLLDPIKLSQYSISPSIISAELAAHGFRTLTGKASNEDGSAMVHVSIPYDCEYDLNQMVVFADPLTHQTVRLRDVARLERRYEPHTPYILYEDTLTKKAQCLIVSVTMHPGNNVVEFGKKVDEKLAEFTKTCTPDIRFHRIVDQPKIVNQSVLNFMRDLLEAILVVILVMLMLFPLQTALVSSTSVPVCIAATFGVMYLFGLELNTVSLAALIVTLGMIVDDSVVVIDGYTELVEKGHSRWYAAAVSTRNLFRSMAIATSSVSLMFFPMAVLVIAVLHDFIQVFPWMLFISLTCSLLYAIWVIPYLSARYIKLGNRKPTRIELIQKRFFTLLQSNYERLLRFCFRHQWGTVAVAAALVVIGGIVLARIDMQVLPKAERDLFAVEVLLESGSSIEETAEVADSLAHMLMADERITGVTRFIGCMPPRYHFAFAPEMARPELAQMIVSTTSEEATQQLMNHLQKKYENYFPIARVRMKQMDYQIGQAPLEVILHGPDYATLEPVADSLLAFFHRNPRFCYIHTNYDEIQEVVEVTLNTDEANRLGVSQAQLSLMLNTVLSGSTLSSMWEGDYNVPITIYTDHVTQINYSDIGDLLVPTMMPGVTVPLRQIADIKPVFHHTSLPHNRGIRSISISTDLTPGSSQSREWKAIEKYLSQLDLPEEVEWSSGGAQGKAARQMPGLIQSLVAAVLIMFVILVFHYGKLGISTLAISMAVICLFGASMGLKIFDLQLSVTALLGVISLISINVRNAIIMYDYAIELRSKRGLSAKEAAFEAGLRRMRPIFLTSATTALGVIPMIVEGSLLWQPMGVVICFGTLLTLPIVVTLMPVAYSLTFEKKNTHTQKGGNI